VLKGSDSDIWTSTWSYQSTCFPTFYLVYLVIEINVIPSPYCHTQPRCVGDWSDGTSYLSWRVPRVFQLEWKLSVPLYIVRRPTYLLRMLPFVTQLYFRKFSTATTVGNTVQISCPTQSWEQYGRNVEEGPGKSTFYNHPSGLEDRCGLNYNYKWTAALYHGGKTWIICEANFRRWLISY
jgi:hypothetical protein